MDVCMYVCMYVCVCIYLSTDGRALRYREIGLKDITYNTARLKKEGYVYRENGRGKRYIGSSND